MGEVKGATSRLTFPLNGLKYILPRVKWHELKYDSLKWKTVFFFKNLVFDCFVPSPHSTCLWLYRFSSRMHQFKVIAHCCWCSSCFTCFPTVHSVPLLNKSIDCIDYNKHYYLLLLLLLLFHITIILRKMYIFCCRKLHLTIDIYT